MPDGLWAWSVWVTTGVCLEIWGVWGNPGRWDTFSEWTAYTTRTDTPAGYVTLTGIMLALLAWYPAHVRALARKNKQLK